MSKLLGISADFLTPTHRADIEHIASGNNISLHYFKDEADLDAVIGECEILYGRIPPEKLRHAASLRWLACAAPHVEAYMDKSLYARDDVLVTNAPTAYAITTSEHILMTMLMLMRRMNLHTEAAMRHNCAEAVRIRSVYDSVITIVGTKDVGTVFAQRAKALGAAHTRGVTRKRSEDLSRYFDEHYAVEDIQFALSGADALILCLPQLDETKNLISAEKIDRLKDTCVLVNVGSPESVDTKALAQALNEGRLGGAALDMADMLSPDDPLWKAKNILLTPHVCSETGLGITCDLDVHMFCDNLKRYCRNQPLQHSVPNYTVF